eukprot:g21707.t1
MEILNQNPQAQQGHAAAARRRQFQQEKFSYDRVPKPAHLNAAVYLRAKQLFQSNDADMQGTVSLQRVKKLAPTVFKQDFSESMADLVAILEAIGSPTIHLLTFLDVLASLETRDAAARTAKSKQVREAAERLDRLTGAGLSAREVGGVLLADGGGAVAGQLKGFHALNCVERLFFDTWQRWRRWQRQRYVLPWWRKSFSQIEARHGASVVSYFLFAQSVFFLNVLTALLFLVLLIPGWKAYKWGSADTSYSGLILGTGLANSWMFYGGYGAAMEGLRMDVLWVLVPLGMLFLALGFNLRYMGGDRDVFGAEDKTPFSALVLGGLDFTLRSRFSMEMQRRQRQRTMGILTEEVRERVKYFQKHHNIARSFEGAMRYATGFSLSLVFGISSAIAIAYIIVFEDKVRKQAFVQSLPFLDDISSLLTPIMVTFFKIITPMVLVALVSFEKHPRALERFRVTFMRLFLSRMAYVVVVLFQTLYLETQKSAEGAICNETMVGIIYWNLVMIDFLIELTVSLVYNPVRLWLIRRALCYDSGHFTYVSAADFGTQPQSELDADFQVLRQDKYKREYNIPKELIDIMYRQALFWAGAPFCPLLPLLAVPHNFLLITAKTRQVRWYSRPPIKPMGVDKQIRYFRGTMIVTLAICIIPYTLFLKREVQCGPHLGSTPIDVFFVWLESGPAWFAFLLSYTRNVLLLWSLVVLMALYCLYLSRRHRGHQAELAWLQRRVRMEVKDKTQIIRSNGILLDQDAERGKFMFRAFMARADMIKFAQRYGERLHSSYFDDLLELVKLSPEEVAALMRGWRVEGGAGPNGEDVHAMTVPEEHIAFFQSKLSEIQKDFISNAAVLQ